MHDFHTFEVAVAVLGGLLVVGALLSGLAKRSFLSLTALFVVAGFVLGEGGLEVLEFDAESGFVQALAIVALILILFRDGLEVEEELLQEEWHLPLRKLVFAMPLTAALVAVVDARADRPRLDRVVPARRAPLPHRPRALVGGRDEPARAAPDTPFAQPRVGA